MICPACRKTVRPEHFACVRCRAMGKVMSEKRLAACRRNALKGGRPKKRRSANRSIDDNTA